MKLPKRVRAIAAESAATISSAATQERASATFMTRSAVIFRPPPSRSDRRRAAAARNQVQDIRSVVLSLRQLGIFNLDDTSTRCGDFPHSEISLLPFWMPDSCERFSFQTVPSNTAAPTTCRNLRVK